MKDSMQPIYEKIKESEISYWQLSLHSVVRAMQNLINRLCPMISSTKYC